MPSVTFLIPVKHDTTDRDTNLRIITGYMAKYFPDCSVLVGEQGGSHYSNYPNYMHFPLLNFHRTKMLNDMAKAAGTEIVVNWDADVLAPPAQLREAIARVESGADFVYPYGGDFTLVNRAMWASHLLKTFDVTPLLTRPLTTRISSVGGAVVCNTASYWRYGGENERMISYAPEDVERWERWHKLGARVERVPGRLFHIQHRRGPDSWVKHPYYADNMRELERVRAMSLDELWSEVMGWRKDILNQIIK